MALTKVECPECGAGLKSSEGFSRGEEVECPKCESTFTVEDPAEDGADDAPRKKKKKKGVDKEKSYKNSPMRFAVLGVLVAVMLVLGGMLFLKMRKDRETEAENAKITARNNEENPNNFGAGGAPPVVAGPGIGIGPAPKNKGGGAFVPPPPPPPALPNGQMPKTGGPSITPKTGGSSGGSGIFAETPFNGTPEAQQLTATLRQKLVGSWEGTAPDGTVHKIAYQANGQFTHDIGGKSTSGMWQPAGLVGGKVLKVNRGAATLKVAFESDGEIVHDTETAGVSLSLKKK